MFFRLLYRFWLCLYSAGVLLVSPFNIKADLYRKGRRGIFDHLAGSIDHSKPIVWIHCASVGEFEQARPIIEEIDRSKEKILLTFFSPSGYELRKNYDRVDWVHYLPTDSRKHAKQFLDIVTPAKAIFIKYDLWYYYLSELKKRAIPAYLVDAIFAPGKIFFKWYGGFFREMLFLLTKIFVQDEDSKTLLSSIGLNDRTFVTGDTRFDRVLKVSEEDLELPVIATFAHNKKTIIVGSSWVPDEEFILEAFALHESKCKLIIAPHEVEDENIRRILNMFRQYNPLRYTRLCTYSPEEIRQMVTTSKVLIIDTIGLLSTIYKYGTFSYIGGGFGASIHNTLESAVYGNPTVFGPKYKKFKEACDLIENGGAKSFKRQEELNAIFDLWLNDIDAHIKSSEAAKNYVLQHKDATKKVMPEIC